VCPPYDQPDENEPGEPPPVQDGLAGLARLAFHQPGGRLAVAQPDRLEQQGGEVDPQGLQGQERHAAGDVEDAGAEEGDDEAEQAAYLEPDVLDQVVTIIIFWRAATAAAAFPSCCRPRTALNTSKTICIGSAY
jgi:hypothetical protein